MDEVILCEYDPNWSALFAQEAARVREAVGDDLLVAVEHFGSTAVPGLTSKPIIDLLVLVRSADEARERAVPPLEAMGYSYWRDNPNREHLFLVKGLPPNGPRTHHIHMIEPGMADPKHNGYRFADRLLFRDYLRAHPEETARYAALKQDLMARFHDDREAYTDAKGEYVLSVMDKARRERS